MNCLSVFDDFMVSGIKGLSNIFSKKEYFFHTTIKSSFLNYSHNKSCLVIQK